jgi:hypothetical protein
VSDRTKAAKSFKVKDQGVIEVVFCTLGVIDHDGDVLYKDSFDDGAPVVISAYGHTSARGELPVGKGRIVMSDTEAKMEGRFFLDTTHGADTYATVKALSDDDSLQEWSFALRDVEAHSDTVGGVKANVIDKVRVPEVSPVLEGAGIATRTLLVKSASKTSSTEIETALRNAARERWGDDETSVWTESWDVDESKAVFAVWKDDEAERLVQVSFERDGSTVTLGDDEADVRRAVEFIPKERASARLAEQAKAVLADLRKFCDRAAEVVAMRSVKGKGLSPDTATVVDELDAQLARLREMAGPRPVNVSASADPLRTRIEIMTMEDA